MSVQNQISTGVISDLFRLLSRPLTLVVVMSSLTLGIYLGFEANHPLLHIGVIMIWSSLFARTLMVKGIQRSSSLLALIGLSLISIGFISAHQQAGRLSISEGEQVEAYQRGRGVAVDYHLGGALKLSSEGEQLTLAFIGGEQVSIDRKNLKPSLIVELGDWQLALSKVTKDFKNPLTRLHIKPRIGEGNSEAFTLNKGQSRSPDGKTVITALNISGDRGGPNAPNLGAGVELLVKWGQRQQRGWHYVNPPNLDPRWGQSPYMIEQVEVIPAQVLHWHIQRTSSNILMILGLILLGLGSGLRIFPSLSSAFSQS